MEASYCASLERGAGARNGQGNTHISIPREEPERCRRTSWVTPNCNVSRSGLTASQALSKDFTNTISVAHNQPSRCRHHLQFAEVETVDQRWLLAWELSKATQRRKSKGDTRKKRPSLRPVFIRVYQPVSSLTSHRAWAPFRSRGKSTRGPERIWTHAVSECTQLEL